MNHDAEYCRRVAESAGFCVYRPYYDENCGIGEIAGYRSSCGKDAFGLLKSDQRCQKCGKEIWQQTMMRASDRKPDVDWNDAMFVAERMQAEFDIALCGKFWSARFRYLDSSKKPVVTAHSDESGPRAICEAILKMKERS